MAKKPPSDVQVPEITPRELKARLDRGDDLFILDVREPHEFQICNLNGHLIPLGELPRRVHELDSFARNRRALPQRKALGRSRRFPAQSRLPETVNLKGGILAWSDEVDPSVPKY